MKTGFYPKLAASSIQKNKQMFTPYILTCMGMVAIFYIILFLAVSDAITPLRGSETLRQVFSLGSWVIAIFSGIFLFYTNSFLIRRRKKEFGLYNILGMGKGNISRILFWETLIIALFSIGMGLFVGIVLSKLAELGLANIMHGPIVYDMSVSILAVKRSIQIFGAIFIFLLLNSIRQVKFSSAISLLRSENMGEKPPKGNWLIGSLGILLLTAAYYLAVTIKTPITASTIFFIAVIMVVIGTYLVMISGSVVFCRLLQKKKSYYYKPNHFISVSSMVYRMKRNGAGLASICILATMILVMMASSACLYFGEESAINGRYPRDINLDFRTDKITDFSVHNTENLKEGFLAELKAYGIVPKNDYFFRHAQLSGVLQNDYVEVDPDKITAEEALNTMHLFYFSSGLQCCHGNR